MSEESIQRIFLEIHTFVIDIVEKLKNIHDNHSEKHSNMFAIQVSEQVFLLPATFNNFAQQARELQSRLQRHSRIAAQTRRRAISHGVNRGNTHATHTLIISCEFDDELKTRLKNLQTNLTDKRMNRMILHLRAIGDAFALYDEIRTNKYSSTFRLLPVMQNIQKQLCCLAVTIQKILDMNASAIEQHLKELQKKFKAYNKDMKNKLAEYISSNIRPPVLVIPCPTNSYSPEVFAQMRSANEGKSNQNIVRMEDVSSANLSKNENQQSIQTREKPRLSQMDLAKQMAISKNNNRLSFRKEYIQFCRTNFSSLSNNKM